MNPNSSSQGRPGFMRIIRFLCLIALGMAESHAQSCWNDSSTPVDFGVVSQDRITDAQGTIVLRCQSNAKVAYGRYCVFISAGSPAGGGGGFNPRKMSNWGGSLLNYDLYSDPGRSQVLGPRGSGYPSYTGTFQVPAGFIQQNVVIPVYGRVPAGQNVLASSYEDLIFNSPIDWAISSSGFPATCTSGGRNGTANTYLEAHATVSAACRISLAQDLDFGSTSALASALDQSSIIIVRCPIGASWTLGLSDGSNGVRRMSDGTGNLVAYELYKDAGRAQRWGISGISLVSGTGGGVTFPQTLPVYGRVPPQPILPAGTYTDTVTATLTF